MSELQDRDIRHSANLIECVLFLSPAPIKRDDFALHFRMDADTVTSAVALLKERYEGAGLELLETAAGLEIATRSEYIEELKIFFTHLEKTRISKAALETLAIVAYKQPITRAEIESIRGVNSQGVINALLEKGMMRICGKSETAGRAYLFSVTDEFLRFIGATSLADIPPLESLGQKT